MNSTLLSMNCQRFYAVEEMLTGNGGLQIVGADNPMLMAAAKQIFGAGGKRMRPALVFLVSRATCQLSNIQYAFSQLRCLYFLCSWECSSNLFCLCNFYLYNQRCV